MQVIVTSWLFPSGEFSLERLQQLSSLVGKEQLVIDLSCRRRNNSWFVAINKWQTVTSLEISKGENVQFQKISIPTPWKVHGSSEGVGGLKSQNFKRKV